MAASRAVTGWLLALALVSIGLAGGAASPPLCLWLGGRIERVTIPSRQLPQPLEARLYLPPCYEQQPYRTYPLLILLHGQNYTDAQWDRLGVDELLDRQIPSGRLPPMVVFMPRERTWELPDDSSFDEALMQEALPWLEARYRLRKDRKYRAIGGISRGAAWAIRLGLVYWQVFGAIGGHSPPVFAGDGLRVLAWLEAIPEGQWPRIYLDIGDADRQEILLSAREFEAQLTRLGIPHEWYFNVGRHTPGYWQRNLHRYLRWYAQPWMPGVMP